MHFLDLSEGGAAGGEGQGAQTWVTPVQWSSLAPDEHGTVIAGGSQEDGAGSLQVL